MGAYGQSNFVIKVYAPWQTSRSSGLVVSCDQGCSPVAPQAMFGVGTPVVTIDRDGGVILLASGEPRHAAPSYLQGRLSEAQLQELMKKATSLGLLAEPPAYPVLGDESDVSPNPGEQGASPWLLRFNAVEFIVDGQSFVHVADDLLHPSKEIDGGRRRLAEFLLLFHDETFASGESLRLAAYSPTVWSIRARELSFDGIGVASLHSFPWTVSTPPLDELLNWTNVDGTELAAQLSLVYESMAKDASNAGASGYYFCTMAKGSSSTGAGAEAGPSHGSYGIEVSPFPSEVMRYAGLSPDEKWVVDNLPAIYP